MKGKVVKKEKSSTKIHDVVVESGATVTVGSDVLVNSGEDEKPFVAHVTDIFKRQKEHAQLKITWYYFPDDVPRGRQPYHAKSEIFKSNHSDHISSKSVIWTCAVLSLEDYISYCRARHDNEHVAIGPIEEGAVGEGTEAGKLIQEANRHRERNRRKQTGDDSGKRKCSSDGGGANKTARKSGENCGPSNCSKKEYESEGDEEEEEEEEQPNLVYICRHEFDAVKLEWKDVEVPVFCLCNLPYNPDLDMIQCRDCAEWFHQDCLQIRDEDLEALCDPETGESRFKCPSCKGINEGGGVEEQPEGEGQALNPANNAEDQG